MTTRTFRVRVYFPETPKREKYVESNAHGFTIATRTNIAAAREARARVTANGFGIRSVSHSPNDTINVYAEPLKPSPTRAVKP